jgi:hypothetical protein
LLLKRLCWSETDSLRLSLILALLTVIEMWDCEGMRGIHEQCYHYYDFYGMQHKNCEISDHRQCTEIQKHHRCEAFVQDERSSRLWTVGKSQPPPSQSGWSLFGIHSLTGCSIIIEHRPTRLSPARRGEVEQMSFTFYSTKRKSPHLPGNPPVCFAEPLNFQFLMKYIHSSTTSQCGWYQNT